MNEFEWLENEINSIGTRRFHLLGLRFGIELSNCPDTIKGRLPEDYLRFVQRFGQVALYRIGLGYQIGVYVELKCQKGRDESLFVRFGHYNQCDPYFKLKGGAPVMIYENAGRGFRLVASSFGQWLKKRATAARKSYSAKEWRQIMAGPPPFTEEEQRIVQARKKFRWRHVGFTETGNVLFEIHNGSEMTLPYFSIKVENPSGTTSGGAWLPVGHIHPGETKVVEKECYKQLIPRDQLLLSDWEDPLPEERDFYWEFRPLKADPRE